MQLTREIKAFHIKTINDDTIISGSVHDLDVKSTAILQPESSVKHISHLTILVQGHTALVLYVCSYIVCSPQNSKIPFPVLVGCDRSESGTQFVRAVVGACKTRHKHTDGGM